MTGLALGLPFGVVEGENKTDSGIEIIGSCGQFEQKKCLLRDAS